MPMPMPVAVAPGQDWTGEAGSWMGSLESNSIANEDKNFVRKQRYPFDEDEGRTKNKYRIDWRIETIGSCRGSGEHLLERIDTS